MKKENLKDVEDVIIEGTEDVKKKINWKLLAKCTAGVLVVGAASVALWKWRKSKKVSTTAVVVSTPSSADGVDSQVASTPNTTVVEI